MSKQLELVNALRTHHGQTPIMGLGEFAFGMTIGQLIVVGPFAAHARLQGGINELWDLYGKTQTEPAPTPMAA